MNTPREPTDAQLWALAAESREDAASAFGVLFDRHASAVYNHCFLLTGSWTIAEDAVSATFLAAWRQHRSIRLIHDSALPWLFTVATNLVRQERRKIARRIALDERLESAHRAGDGAVPDHSDSVAGRIDGERRWRHLTDAVHRLPRAEREAFVLCVWDEVSYPDAAAVLGIAQGSVRARVSRARARLRNHLDVGKALEGLEGLEGLAALPLDGESPGAGHDRSAARPAGIRSVRPHARSHPR